MSDRDPYPGCLLVLLVATAIVLLVTVGFATEVLR